MSNQPVLSEYDMDEYARRVAEIMQARARGACPLAYTHTYGCQSNVADGERINGLLQSMGFDFTDDPEEADLILYNTCAVREHAEDRVFGNVGALKHIKRRHPDVIIALCGCMMQQESAADRIRSSYPYVSLVFGTHVIHRLPELLYRLITGGRRVFELSQEDSGCHEDVPARRDSKIKAWLPIMYGCNNFCTYCIVPYVRGRERSRSIEAVEAEFRSIVDQGYRDITLLGQNVNSYGRSKDSPSLFPELLRRLDSVDGDYLIRFMTSHPKDCSEELLGVMSEGKHIARHLHLPFQSGSDEILRRMNRNYTAERYLELVDTARRLMPDISLTSDVIVGFPGETAEQFEDTLELVRRVRFTSLFTFIYSKRKGTPAAEMPDPVTAEEKVIRMQRLLALQDGIAAERCASSVGRTFRVLAEGSENGLLSCRTSGNVIITVDGDASLEGTFFNAKVTAARNWTLSGVPADSGE